MGFSSFFMLTPSLAISTYGLLPAPAPASRGLFDFGRRKDIAPSEAEVRLVTMLVQLCGVGMLSWYSLFSPIARVGDVNTVKWVCALFTLARIPMVMICLTSGNPEMVKMVYLNVVLMVVCAMGATRGGLPKPPHGLRDGGGASGRAMAFISLIALINAVQSAVSPMSFTHHFGVSVTHPDTTRAVEVIMQMWGLVVSVASTGRLVIVYANHGPSMYSACRGMAMYYAVFFGYMCCFKEAGVGTRAVPMTAQTVVMLGYVLIAYFAGIYDDRKAKFLTA